MASKSIPTCNLLEKEALPVILACQGRTNVAQLANDLALIMDHEGLAVMGSTTLLDATLDAKAANVVVELSNAQKILVLEGCRKGCVQTLLSKICASPCECMVLTDFGIEPEVGESCSYSQMNHALRQVQQRLVEMQSNRVDIKEVNARGTDSDDQ